MIALLISSLTLVAGQAAIVCNAGNNKNTFNQCIADGVVDTSGQRIPPPQRIPATACNAYRNDNPLYLDCLCQATTAISRCFVSYCPTDPQVGGYQEQEKQVCNEANKVRPTTTRRIVTATAVPTGSTASANEPATFSPSASVENVTPALLLSVMSAVFAFQL
ncbi:hypothetical protein HDV02_001635 [Globomyces sp. JEL0801]|nr:hypothetical protein HDV02_001635 [Globomyces sp. JEL0801]